MERAAAAVAVSVGPSVLEHISPVTRSRAKSYGSGLVAAGSSSPRGHRLEPGEAGSGSYCGCGSIALGIAAAVATGRHLRKPAAESLRQRQQLRGSSRLSVICCLATPTGEPSGPGGSENVGGGDINDAVGQLIKASPAEARAELVTSTGQSFRALSEGQKSAVSGFFFPDQEQLDMDKSMPLEDHLSEFRDGVLRSVLVALICVGVCLTFYKELTLVLESPAFADGNIVKFVQLAPGEFFFVSVKAAAAVGFLLAFPYILFEGALYLTPALTRDERNTLGPAVLGSAVLFYSGVFFSQLALAPAALGFFISYGADVIENQFSIDQYFEFILSMGFATGLAFQVPVLQVTLGLLGLTSSEQLLSIWRYVIVGSSVVGAILTPSTDPVTQCMLSGALCILYFAGAGVLKALGK